MLGAVISDYESILHQVLQRNCTYKYRYFNFYIFTHLQVLNTRTITQVPKHFRIYAATDLSTGTFTSSVTSILLPLLISRSLLLIKASLAILLSSCPTLHFSPNSLDVRLGVATQNVSLPAICSILSSLFIPNATIQKALFYFTSTVLSMLSASKWYAVSLFFIHRLWWHQWSFCSAQSLLDQVRSSKHCSTKYNPGSISDLSPNVNLLLIAYLGVWWRTPGFCSKSCFCLMIIVHL